MMVKKSNDHDGIDLVVHLIVDRDVGAGLAVPFAKVANEFHAGRKRRRRQVILDDLNVPVVPA
jgi:hypothetical protein